MARGVACAAVRPGLECGHLFHAAPSAKEALSPLLHTIPPGRLRARACAGLALGLMTLLMPGGAAQAQAATPRPDYLKATESIDLPT